MGVSSSMVLVAPLVVGRIQSSLWKKFGKCSAGPKVMQSKFLTWSELAMPSLL